MSCLSHNISEDGRQAIKPWSVSDCNQQKAQMLSEGVKSGSDLFQSLVNLRGSVLPSELHCMVLPQPKQHREGGTIWQHGGLCFITNFYLKSLRVYIFLQSHQLSILYAWKQATWQRYISHNTPWHLLLLTQNNVWRDLVPSHEIRVSCPIWILVRCRRMGM